MVKTTSSTMTAVGILGLLWGCASTGGGPGTDESGSEPSQLLATRYGEEKVAVKRKIEALDEEIEYFEERREELIERKVTQIKKDMERESALVEQLQLAGKVLQLTEEQLSLKHAELQEKSERRELKPELVSAQDIQELEGSIELLFQQVNQGKEERRRIEEVLGGLSQELDAVLGTRRPREVRIADRERVFDAAMNELYRQALELYLRLYELMVGETRLAVISDSEKMALLRIYRDQIDKLQGALDRSLSREVFSELRISAGRDASLSVGLLSSHIFPVEFALGSADLDIAPPQIKEFKQIAEVLRERRYETFGFLLFIDGHADSVSFAGDACASAEKNKELSRLRARETKRHFVEELGMDAQRVHIDWYGNYSQRVASRSGGEPENRRIELRITTVEDGDYTSHRDYFRMRQGLAWGKKTFRHDAGRWVDEECRDRGVDEKVYYLGEEYAEVAAALGLGGLELVSLDDERGELLTRLGNELVVEYQGRCVRVDGCSGEALGTISAVSAVSAVSADEP